MFFTATRDRRNRSSSVMTTAEVSDEDFREIRAQPRLFVRSAVVPREQEILADDRVPDDLREQAAKMGLFGYAIPQEFGGLGLNLAQDVEMAMELGYTSLRCGRCSAPTTASRARCSWGSAPTSRRRSGSSGWPPAKWPRSR